MPFWLSRIDTYSLDLPWEPCNNYPVQTGRVWGCSSAGRRQTPRGRRPRECNASLQAQGATERHHEGGQASLVLPKAGREEAGEASIGRQRLQEEGPHSTG